MQEMEFSKGSAFALTLSLAGETIVDFAQELREAKAALLKWRNKRKAKCQEVLLNVLAPPKEHAEIRRLLEHLPEEEAVGPFLKSVRAEVALLNDQGKALNQFLLNDKTAEAIQPARSPAPAAAPAPAPAAKPSADDDEDDVPGSAYTLGEMPAPPPPVEEEKKKKKKDEPKVVRKKLKKKRVQFAVEWQAVQTPLLLFIIGLGVWGLVWLLQLIVLIMAMFGDVSYGPLVDEVLYKPKEEVTDYELGEYD